MSPKICSLALEEEAVDSYQADLKLVLKELPIEIGETPYQGNEIKPISIVGKMTVSF